MFQHVNAQPHVTMIFTQFLEAENVPVLPWPEYSPDMTPIEHVWDALDQRCMTVCSSSCPNPDTDWFSDPHPYLFLKAICDQHMQICIPNHVKSIG